jgi:hypothetical protein
VLREASIESIECSPARPCAGLGHPGLEGLALQNADYLVEGLVAQLERPEHHPQAPALLATLLQTTAVTPALLPLLSEPACCAIERLSASARAARPQHTRAFLGMLAPLMHAAASLGHALDAESTAQAEIVQHRLKAQLEEVDRLYSGAERRSTPSADATAHVSVVPGGGSKAGSAQQEGPVGAYFQRHNEEADARERAGRVHLQPHERQTLDRRRAQTYAALELAAAVAKAAAPLLLSEALPLCVAAHEVVIVRSITALACNGLTCVAARLKSGWISRWRGCAR